MESYIVCQFIEEFEVDATKPDINAGTKVCVLSKQSVFLHFGNCRVLF